MNPVLSIVTPTYNAEKQLERYFFSLEKQTFPKSLFEILILDGGSTDKTRDIARLHRARIIHNPLKLAEPGVALGFQKAKGELVMVMAADNIYRDVDALAKIVSLFNDKTISAAFPKHDTAPDDLIYSGYINTFTDPFSHFVYGKASNARTFKDVYKTIKHTEDYDMYDFKSSSQKPLLALAQGFTVRKKELINRSRDQFDDVLAIYSLIEKGRRIAYAYSVVLYHYSVRNLKDFAKKQRRSVENALVRRNSGISKRSGYLTTGQKIRQYVFFPYALTIVIPLLQSLIQAARTREKAWLLHWYMSFVSAVILILTALSL